VTLRVAIVLALLLGQDARWKAGFAKVRITPEEPLPMAGYAARSKPFEGVAGDLYIKALALQDCNGRKALWITADHIGWLSEIAAPVAEALVQKTGLPREAILLNASHTHAGPRLTLTPGSRSGVSEKEALKCVEYTKALLDKTVDAAVRALAALEPATLTWGKGAAGFIVNRRERTERGIMLGVNREGPVDRSVPVLRIDGADGRLRGIVFGAACHNTTLTSQNLQISGDYAGIAQAWIESQRKGVEAMFVIGCGGDANPNPRGSLELARGHGEGLGREVWRVAHDEKRSAVSGALSTALQWVDLPFQALDRAQAEKIATAPGAQATVAQQMLLFFDNQLAPPARYRAPVAVWKFGADLTLVGLPGETVVDYALAVEKLVDPKKLWVAGYCNDKFGYLPSKRVAEEGGYEAQGLTKGFGGPGFFAPEAEGVILAAVKNLLRP
jgi:neutral ceramidase